MKTPRFARKSHAADAIDSTLAYEPNQIGVSRGDSRFIAYPPLAILFRVIEDDRQVRVIYVKHWLD